MPQFLLCLCFIFECQYGDSGVNWPHILRKAGTADRPLACGSSKFIETRTGPNPFFVSVRVVPHRDDKKLFKFEESFTDSQLYAVVNALFEIFNIRYHHEIGSISDFDGICFCPVAVQPNEIKKWNWNFTSQIVLETFLEEIVRPFVRRLFSKKVASETTSSGYSIGENIRSRIMENSKHPFVEKILGETRDFQDVNSKDSTTDGTFFWHCRGELKKSDSSQRMELFPPRSKKKSKKVPKPNPLDNRSFQVPVQTILTGDEVPKQFIIKYDKYTLVLCLTDFQRLLRLRADEDGNVPRHLLTLCRKWLAPSGEYVEIHSSDSEDDSDSEEESSEDDDSDDDSDSEEESDLDDSRGKAARTIQNVWRSYFHSRLDREIAEFVDGDLFASKLNGKRRGNLVKVYFHEHLVGGLTLLAISHLEGDEMLKIRDEGLGTQFDYDQRYLSVNRESVRKIIRDRVPEHKQGNFRHTNQRERICHPRLTKKERKMYAIMEGIDTEEETKTSFEDTSSNDASSNDDRLPGEESWCALLPRTSRGPRNRGRNPPSSESRPNKKGGYSKSKRSGRRKKVSY